MPQTTAVADPTRKRSKARVAIVVAMSEHPFFVWRHGTRTTVLLSTHLFYIGGAHGPVRREGARERLTAICLEFPWVAGTSPAGTHVAYAVRGKKFAYFLDNHHGDGRVAVTFRAAPGEQESLVATMPGRFFVPPYLGPRGWVASTWTRAKSIGMK